jgi:hypothetical protein
LGGVRIALFVVLVGHGLIHLMGFAKAFGFAELPQLVQPISRPMGVVWLVAALLMIAAAFLPWRAFWLVAAVALVASQIAITSSWSDAKLGTILNAIVLLAAAYGFAAWGPFSLPVAYAGDAERAIASSLASPPTAPLTEADLLRLPPPVQRYVRAAGAVGKPMPRNVRARWRGRIRGTASDPWMELVAEQVNTFGPSPSRVFLIDATMKHLPVATYHRFIDDAATFKVRLLGVATVVDAEGPELTRAETVTLLNDLCMLAPGALVDPSIRWEPIDATSARVIYTRGTETVSAELRFDASGFLTNFISEDRSRSSSDGTAFTRMRWSTPLREPRPFGSARLASRGEARWHEPGGAEYAYVELELLEVGYDVAEP